MTRLGMNTVKREVETAGGLTLVVTFTPAGITTREKGRRMTYGPVPYGHVHLDGARMKADEAKREKLARRKLNTLNRRSH